MFLFVGQRFNDNSNAFVADVVAAEIELFDCFAEAEAVFECFNSLQSNLVLLQIKYFQILFVLEGGAEGDRTFGEDAIV